MELQVFAESRIKYSISNRPIYNNYVQFYRTVVFKPSKGIEQQCNQYCYTGICSMQRHLLVPSITRLHHFFISNFGFAVHEISTTTDRCRMTMSCIVYKYYQYLLSFVATTPFILFYNVYTIYYNYAKIVRSKQIHIDVYQLLTETCYIPN